MVVLTLDTLGPQKWETFVRLRRTDTHECGSCHGANAYLSRKPNFEGIDLIGAAGTAAANLTWDYVKRLRDPVAAKIVLKGILAPEDAKLAAEVGSMASSSPITAAEPRTAVPPSMRCPTSSKRSPAACPS